jgi:hypothetical protein
MSNIKDLFGKNNIKVLPGKSLGNLVTGSGVESAGYIQSTDEEKLRFEPYVDYSIPKSFARYGSAEKYYTDTIDYIINRYPYDGSGKEKANWYLSSSYFDNYLFENEYPRTHGFINLGINYGGVGGGGVSGYEAPTVDEYIYFKGGPHTASAGMDGKPLSQTFTGSNYYKDDVRESNLELNAPVGNSVEFWFKKNGWTGDPVESEKQIFVDVWNSASIGNTYGRFRVECDFGITPHQFSVAFQSGTTNGFLDSDLGKIGQSINLTGSTWNHYALTFANVGSDLEAKLYVNGDLNDTITTGSIINKITGSMLGWIGAMGTSINSPVTGALGYAKLSGSMDEFRFWKSSRTETEVGRYWFTQVNAGSNTDLSNVDLGVYYKFNEGIVDTTAIATLDTNVLDYSGRITNGSWTGYDLGSRDTGSAMVISKAALSEFKDPIIYPSNPLVSVFRTTKKNIGYDYDVRNNSGIYTSIPEYITGDSQEIRGGTLKNLTQIIGSYFDDVQLQIESLPKVKNVQYTTGSQKIAPFINRFLSGVGLYTPEIFADASALEYYASRDDFLDFSKKLNDTKNRIYENIYNNLVHVFKTKGTENSFRNLMRCYGVDEPLMKISLYGDETTQELRTNSRNTTAQKSFVDFNNVDRFDSTVYQQTSSTDTNTRNFITASSDMQFIPKTMQAEAIFPKKFKQDSELYFRTPFISCSLFGAHTPTSADQTDLTWATNDWSNFQVYAVRTEIESDDVYFKLTSSAGGVIPLITSSVYTDVYANTKWNLAVRIKPDNYYIPGLSGSEAGSASVEFVGYNSLGDNVENNFYLTASISLASASAFLSSSTRVYAGSHRTNFTGSSIDLSDAKISSVRYWIDDLPNEAIEAHSKDASAFGPLEPHKSAYLVKNTVDFFQQIEAPQAKTLSLSWTFDTVTGSSDSSTGSPTLSDANFFVPDLSSGSTATTSEYGWLGPVVNFLHSGKGDFFLPFDTNAVNREYVYSAKQLAPEILNSSNMVEVRTQDDELFTRETRPQNYFYAIEKSQSAIISEEMMKWFATIKDFNFLIGDPVNRYRQEYKPLAKLREVYFRSVGNTIDFERFVDFFKWVDDSLSQMLMQLVPASANFAEKVRTMIESHVLERNKYWSKFPTLEMKISDPEAGLRGIVEGVYPWKRGHAPIPLAQDDNCYWANNRASASVFPSGDTEIDAERNIYRLANDFLPNANPPTLADVSSGTPVQYQGSAYAVRNFTKTYLLRTKEMPELKGGTNVARIKNLQYAHTELPFGASTKLTISSSQVEGNIDCNDVVDPNDKVKLRYKLTNNPIGYKSGNGNIFAPFDLMSSSVSSGYASELPLMGPDAVFVDLVNYHNDTYGSDKEVPMQGPFTEKYVGGWKHRHVPFPNTNCSPSTGSLATGSLADQCRPEAWNLGFDGSDLEITPRTTHQARSTILREPLAKRPVNIRNIKQTTGSTIIGNYSHQYEVLQTSGRKINNRFFVKNNGFVPEYSVSSWVSGLVEYALPDFSKYGATKNIFVERFNAPGGPDVSSRGVLDLYAEEYAIRNDLNQRNMVVRGPLNEWSTEHCGQFGIKSGSTVNELNYNTSASYFKVNRNPLKTPYIVDIYNLVGYTNEKSIKKAGNHGATSLIGTATEQPHLRITPISASAPFPSTVSGFGVSFWFYTTSSYGRDRNLIARWESDNRITTTAESDWRIYIPENETNVVRFEMMDLNTGTPQQTEHISSNVVDSAWHHVLATYTRTPTGPTYDWDMSIIVDGNLDGADTFSLVNSVNTTTARTYIGAQYDSDIAVYTREACHGFGSGSLDELAIWYDTDTPPGLAEASLLYNSGCPTDLQNTVGVDTPTNWWRMGDPPGYTIGAVTSSIADVIGINTVEVHYPKYAKADDFVPSVCSYPQTLTTTSSYGCKTQYDNWWVQHPIPRSDYQYAWITASAITSSGCDFIGHAGSPDCGRNNFSVPSGSSESMAAPAIQFVESTELWIGDPDAPLTHKITCSYNGVFTIFGTDYPALYLDQYVNQLTSSTNTISPGSVFVNTALSKDINYYFLNLNGPYGYPSWKQIRTGETPVARHQKNNNIISFKKEVDIYGSNEVTPANAGLTRDTLIHFTTPPVTFRYKPVGTTLILSGSPDPLTLDSVYGNNMGGFPNPDINNFLGTSIKCEEQMFDRIKGMYHNAPSDSPVEKMVSVDYNEIVYPREIHAGLKEYRQRTEYAEVANGTNIYSGGNVIFVSASLSNGSNGIDRGPLYRRTFWRNDPVFRNRRIGQGLIVVSPASKVPIITGALPNSQGHYDGFATSINGWGNTPVSFVDSLGGTAYTWNLSGSQAPGTMTLLDYPDMGELNSANFQTISGYGGTAGFSDPAAVGASILKLPVSSTYYPTASAYYYHQHIIYNNAMLGTSSLGMKWRVAELSGKNPWFDTYEDYVQDIRGTGKSFTIIPEFRISQHMDYYADGLFRKQNDQFLTLDGATITSSAVAPTSSDLSRGFDKQFFSEYSNTDFQKYFGKFDADNQVSEITLKCNGIKKLLPYHGFYPSHRTLQVASLFSQSIAPYIGGIAWASGTTTEPASSYPSGALAVQSLLQPYYAPGIVYNTIKAGIACDWAAYTGSSGEGITGGTYLNGFLSESSNYRIPFESILDPLADIGIPESSSNGQGKLNLLYPTYQINSTYPNSWAFAKGAARLPYADLDNLQRARAISSPKYSQYRLAINNLLAEIPSFFLKDNQLKTIVSKPAGDVSLVSGSTYYMNVYLEKDPNIVMIQDYWNGINGGGGQEPNAYPLTSDTEYRSYNGRYFGPAVIAGGGGTEGWGPSARRMGDPAYAPYTPPYFYGKSISTIAYVADASDESGGFNYKKVFEKATVTQTNPTMKGMFETIRSGQTDPSINAAIALSGAMGLSSSLSLFGLFSEKETRVDDAGNLIEVVNAPDSDRNKWVISPRMETPVLDFSTQPEQKGWGRGMWSGYGNILTSSNGITFGIEETFKGPTTDWCASYVNGNKLGWYSSVDVLVAYTGDSSSVTKTGGGSSWNAGAAGRRLVPQGGYWEYEIDSLSNGVWAGLNDNPNLAPDYVDMNFSIRTESTFPYAPGHLIFWENIEGGTITDVLEASTFTKTAVPPGWCNNTTWPGACCRADGPREVRASGYFEYEIDLITDVCAMGIVQSPSSKLQPTDDWDYAVYTDSIGGLLVYENGVNTHTNTYLAGDVIRIERDGNDDVLFRKNGVTFYTSVGTATGLILYPTVSIWGNGSQMLDISQYPPAGSFLIYENGIAVNDPPQYVGSYLPGDKVRIARGFDDMIRYQHLNVGSGIWTTLDTSTTLPPPDVYPDCVFYAVGDSLSNAVQFPSDPLLCLRSGSLLQKCFTNPEEKQVGEIASQKEISEAIVAIPFSVRGFSKESRHPETTVVMDKNFFRIDQDVFDANRQHYLRSKNKIFSAHPLLGQSVTKMLKMMDKYIIPPELDSLNFPEGNLKVDPFVMYMFEFNHSLSQQDLADIWQGVMPDISRIAQLSDTTVDDNVFTHPTGPNEFFGGKMIPEDIRWMVFKVKKRGNFNYYKMTADTSDDDKFNFDFNVGGKDLPYSYNWPYDFCSLVELAEIEVKDQFITSKPVIEIPGSPLENAGVSRILDHLQGVSTGSAG